MRLYQNIVRLMLKISAVFVIIALFFAVSFYLFGGQAELVFSREQCIKWFLEKKQVAWIFGIILLVSDILLPVPATGIMAALGAVYDLWPGMLISMTGSSLAGLLGYAAARFLSKRTHHIIATEDEILRFKSFFDTYGDYAIIISRIMPLMPEVITILAGLSGMKFPRFFASLIAGTLPVSILFTWMGTNESMGHPVGILLAVILPAVIWPFFIKFARI